MKALLLVAHGSRKPESNEEVRQLAQRLKAQSPEYELVQAAFLELAQPSIPAGIQACIDQGANEILVLPYFLSAGRHVSHDVPSLVHEKRLEHPAIAIKMVNYLGAAQGLVQLMLETVKQGDCQMCAQQSQCEYPQCLHH